ncbi:MAG: CCGSCS motif protein [Marinobacter psychrophilus]|jgi:CCGSCS motif protein
MVQSFKDVFKGKKAESVQADSAQHFDPKAQEKAAVDAEMAPKKKGKHGDPGVYCGSCS